MKKTIIPVLLFVGLSSFGQSAKKDSANPVKHDTVNIVIRQYYDTIKVEIAYYNKSYVRITTGHQIRLIEMNSTKPDVGIIKGSSLYDDKWKPFRKILFNISQIIEPTKK